MSSEEVVAALRGRGSVPSSGAGSGSGRSRGLDYDGRVGEVAGIAVTNGLLGLVTLGFYRFWGKTRLRRYLWGRVGFDGDAFEYSGTGKELFIGFLVAIAVLIPLGALGSVVEFAFPADPMVAAVSGIVQGLLIALLVQFAIYRARRYRLTRSQWRGIRGGQTGSAVTYAFVALGWYVLVAITLGLAYAAMRTALQRYRTENTWFGTERFTLEPFRDDEIDRAGQPLHHGIQRLGTFESPFESAVRSDEDNGVGATARKQGGVFARHIGLHRMMRPLYGGHLVAAFAEAFHQRYRERGFSGVPLCGGDSDDWQGWWHEGSPFG